jgi:hypothetical protein
MPTVSINFLSRHTGKDRRTIKRRLDKLPADASGKFDSVTALEAIYCGTPIGENGFISTPEAIRQLTIAKKEQIELQNQIARSERIPIGDVNEAVGQVFGAIRGIVKANLSVDHANEVFDEMRRVCDWIQQKANEVE